MSGHRARAWLGRVGGLAVPLLAFFPAGCQTAPTTTGRDRISPLSGAGTRATPPPPPIAADQVPTRDDIVSIYQYWKPVPWRMVDDRAVGFSVPTYFISAETQKGVFVSGKILVWMYELLRGADGSTEKQCVHVWEFDRAAALGYRVRKLAVMGYYYGFALTWPPNVDVAGRQVEIVFGYERADGQIVTASPRRVIVPGPNASELAARDRPSNARSAAPAPAPTGRRPLAASPEMQSRVRTKLRELKGAKSEPGTTDDAPPASEPADARPDPDRTDR